MKKFILASCITALTAVFGAAQAPSGDYKKAEGFIGYSNGQVDTGFDSGSTVQDFFDDRETFHGFNASGVYNLNRWFGIKGDISGTYNNTRFSETIDTGGGTNASVSFKTNNSLYNFLGGVQVKDNSKSGRLKPFGHVMVGAAHAKTKFKDFTCTPSAACGGIDFADDDFGDTGWAGAIGGGLDIRMNNRFQIRAFQVDYNPTRIEGSTQHNIRIGAGIVF